MIRRPLRNLTVTLDEETFARARVRAAERNLSLSRFIGELLRRELRHDDEYESAYRTWRAARSFALKGPAERYPKREDLHDRALLRRR
jgi:hypothetical protein